MKKAIIIIGLLLLVGWGALTLFRIQAKSKSPESGLDFTEGDLKIYVFYNRPYKKGREIFSKNGLVPFDKVWRTGANEATYLETNKTLLIKGKELKSGKYSLWTIPGEQTWTVIFNSDYPSWGRTFDKDAAHDEKFDVMRVEVPVVIQDKVIEQFTISVERVDDELELIFLWDKTLIAVPFTVAGQSP